MRPLLLFVGPSGSGKTTVAQALADKFNLKSVSSFTTRPRRFEGETGHDFITYEEYLSMMMDKQLVAYTEINGNFYGATKRAVDDAEIYIIDPYGAIQLRQLYHEPRNILYVYFDCDEEMCKERMEARGTPNEIEKRKAEDAKIRADNEEASKYFKHYRVTNDKTPQETADYIYYEIYLSNF